MVCGMFVITVCSVVCPCQLFCNLRGRRYVCCVNVMLSLISVMSPLSALCNLSARTVVKLCYLGMFALGVRLVF